METRTFRMNNKLLFDVITRQAGTIEKAWLEIVQNAIDAGATNVSFKINKDKFKAEDNGKGMNRKEIVTYFEEFGNSSKQENDLGEFGMGRGQIFAQGKTIWKTQDYKMIVDIKEKGLNYKLDENNNVKGTCIEVELYNNIKFLEKKIERFKEMVKFVSINIFINNNKINEKYEITLETKEGIILLTSDDKLKIYNRGIFVKDEYFGNGAIIISKMNLKVNFARNDIFDDCEVYNKLLEETKKLIVGNLEDKQNLSTDDRKTIIALMREDNKWIDKFEYKNVIPTANGNFISIKEVEESKTVYFSDGKNHYEDDLLIEQGYTVLKNNPIIHRLLNSIEAIRNVGNYEDLVSSFRMVTRKEINEEDLTIQELNYWKEIKLLNSQMKGVRIRQLRIAKNLVASANTDGKNVITFNYNNIKNYNYKYIIYLLLHEYSHESDTANTDEHGYEFYQKFYELIKENYNLLDE